MKNLPSQMSIAQKSIPQAMTFVIQKCDTKHYRGFPKSDRMIRTIRKGAKHI